MNSHIRTQKRRMIVMCVCIPAVAVSVLGGRGLIDADAEKSEMNAYVFVYSDPKKERKNSYTSCKVSFQKNACSSQHSMRISMTYIRRSFAAYTTLGRDALRDRHHDSDCRRRHNSAHHCTRTYARKIDFIRLRRYRSRGQQACPQSIGWPCRWDSS